MVSNDSSLPVLISAHEASTVFSLPHPAVEGSNRVALVSAGNAARVNPLQAVYFLIFDFSSKK